MKLFDLFLDINVSYEEASVSHFKFVFFLWNVCFIYGYLFIYLFIIHFIKC